MVCIRQATVHDLLQMQTTNLWCLPENYQVRHAEKSENRHVLPAISVLTLIAITTTAWNTITSIRWNTTFIIYWVGHNCFGWRKTLMAKLWDTCWRKWKKTSYNPSTVRRLVGVSFSAELTGDHSLTFLYCWLLLYSNHIDCRPHHFLIRIANASKAWDRYVSSRIVLIGSMKRKCFMMIDSNLILLLCSLLWDFLLPWNCSHFFDETIAKGNGRCIWRRIR